MNETYVRVDRLERISRGDEARRLAHAVYEALLDDLRRLPDGAWSAPTVCEGWTVADVVRHLVGAAKGHVSLRENARQTIWGARHKGDFGGNELDAMNALQVADHVHLAGPALVEALTELGPRAVEARMSRPGLFRRLSIPNPAGGSTPAGSPVRLALGELFDVILTRDVWLHRIDIARAVGSVPGLTDVDRRIIEDVITEWWNRHGRPFDLTLTGPAGGRYVAGDDGQRWSMDVVEFCETLSGRKPLPVDPQAAELLQTRVLF